MLEPIYVAQAHRLAALGRLDLINGALHSAGTRRSTARLVLEAVRAQYSGDMERCVSIFEKALRVATEPERAYVIDLFWPVLVMHGRTHEAREVIESVAVIPEELSDLFRSMTWVLSALEGNESDSPLSMDLCHADELHRARALQRVSAAAYYSKNYDLAADAAKQSARIFERIGSHRSAAASLSVLYNVHHTKTGDIEEAYRTTKLIVAAARKAHDASFEMTGLVAQYEIAAEFGDAAATNRLKCLINKVAMPTQYRERFARGVADTLPYGWTGDFEAFNANAIMLREIGEAGRPNLAFASALRSIAEAALGDVASARRSSRNAIGLAALAETAEPAYDARYRRLARALAAATCVLIGDATRGERTVNATKFRDDDAIDIFTTADGREWRSANRRVRGYARVVAAARSRLKQSGSRVLTTAEYDVLRMLAEGKSAVQVAVETKRSVHTIRAHTRNIIEKFEVNGRGSAISHARRTGILP